MFELFRDPAFVERALGLFTDLTPGLVYFAIGTGAGLENLFPPIPADTFVVFGAFLSAHGQVTAVGVFLATWISNTASTLVVYGLGHRFGAGVFGTTVGRWLLRPRQLRRLAALYDAHGFKIIFVSRFLPGFRAVVPAFAGISRLAFWRTAVPLGLASAIWYGVLVYLGVMLGRNWQTILGLLENVNAMLVAMASAVAVIGAVVWWKTRHHPHETAGEGEA